MFIKASNVFFLIAIVFRKSVPWFTYIAIASWLLGLILLIKKDAKSKKVTVSTIVYIVFSVALLIFLVIAAVK